MSGGEFEERLFFRVAKDAVKELDALIAKENRANPRTKVARPDVLRRALWREIDAAKAGGEK